jgi:hypothetical protein
VLGKEGRKINEDWCSDVHINTGQEKNETRMKLLNRNTRQNRELYKERKKKRSVYIVWKEEVKED